MRTALTTLGIVVCLALPKPTLAEKGLGVSRDKLQHEWEKEFDFTFTMNDLGALIGTSPDDQPGNTMLIVSNDLTTMTFMIFVNKGTSKADARANAFCIMAFLKYVFPDWKGVEDWFGDSMKKVRELEEGGPIQTKKTTKGKVEAYVKLNVWPTLGVITVVISDESD